MSDAIWLDALFPPSPDDLVRDMDEAGAEAVAIYVLRRDALGGVLSGGGWTVAHVERVQAAGKYVVPIVVPGNRPPETDWNDALDHAHAFGVPTSFIVLDLETFSFPPVAWVRGFIDHAHAAGWKVLRYGDTAALAGYPPADGDWISHGAGILVRSGSYRPAPKLPDGLAADQYAVGAFISNHAYDVSVARRGLLGSQAPTRSTSRNPMSNNIQIPDPKSETGLFDVILEKDTHRLHWGFVAGGEGAEEGDSDWLNPLPDADDGPVLGEPGTLSGFGRVIAGVSRITVSCRRQGTLDTWMIVMHGESPWEALSPWAKRKLNVTPEGAVQGPKGDPGPPAKVDDVVAEIAKRLAS